MYRIPIFILFYYVIIIITLKNPQSLFYKLINGNINNIDNLAKFDKIIVIRYYKKVF